MVVIVDAGKCLIALQAYLHTTSMVLQWEGIEQVPGSTLPIQTGKNPAESTSLSHLVLLRKRVIQARST